MYTKLRASRPEPGKEDLQIIESECRLMKLAFHMHAVRMQWAAAVPTPAEQAATFARISRAGFEGIDISDSWDFASLDAAGAALTRKLAQDHGLTIPTISCMGKTLCHPDLGQANFEAVERALDTACGVGACIVNIGLSIPRMAGVVPVMGAKHSPGGSAGASDADYAMTAARLRELARRAKERGLSLSIELHDRGLADTSASLLRILDETAQDNVGANPDLCNGYRAYSKPPESWREALRRLAPRSNLWHVNNLQRVHFPEIDRAAFVECSLGEGDVDYRLAVKEMKAAGFDGWVVVEYKGLGDPLETLFKGRKYFSRILEETPD